MAEVVLNAKTARLARSEISSRWPKREVEFRGVDKDGETVLISLVRRNGDKAHVAITTRNRGDKPVKFIATIKDV